jgi:hypothetical protein
MVLSLIAVWFLSGETHRGQQWTPALTLPQVRYGLSVLLMEVFCTPGMVAYLLATDNVSGLLPIRLRESNQPMIRTRNRFSSPRPCLLTCI